MSAPSPKLTVHHLQVGQGERVPWLLEELGLPYDLKLYPRSPIQSPPELAAKHALGASPIIEDATSDPEHPVELAESAAILEYIIHKYGSGRLALPPSHKDYADYLYWFHFANGSLQPAIMRRMLVSSTSEEDMRFKMTDGRLRVAINHLNQRLEEKPWLAGDDFTAADIMPLFSLTTMRQFLPIDLTGYGGILAWLKRCTTREAYKTAMRKSDPEAKIDDLISAKGPAKFAALAVFEKK